ncbi:hypothetical protein ELBI_40 [Anabaena phage Elbi]|nr:hypothetical protein ELBI_40 [Anabaena phage Elbi]
MDWLTDKRKANDEAYEKARERMNKESYGVEHLPESSINQEFIYESFTGDPEVEARAKAWQNGDYDDASNEFYSEQELAEIKNQDYMDNALVLPMESYLNDSTVSFNDVVTELAKHGYELHRNVDQFFTESKAPYVYFKTGESDYAIHVTYFLDTIIESVTEIVSHKINMVRFHQVASELSKTDDQSGENLTGTETLSDRLTMLEKRLISAVEQRRIIVRSICAEIGKVILVWMTGIGFGVKESVSKIHTRANRKIQRHARSFYKMLTEKVAYKYHIEHF